MARSSSLIRDGGRGRRAQFVRRVCDGRESDVKAFSALDGIVPAYGDGEGHAGCVLGERKCRGHADIGGRGGVVAGRDVDSAIARQRREDIHADVERAIGVGFVDG